jgi:putative oxidoreductase
MNTSSVAAHAHRFNPKAAITVARGASAWVERWITPLLHLGARVYLFDVFFRSGWLKISDWSTTLLLFHNDYHVPLLPPDLAAVLGTAGELGFSVVGVLGLAGRCGALGLFFVNLVAANSFPDISALGLKDHVIWGVLLAVLVLHGPGRFSLDSWLRGRAH